MMSFVQTVMRLREAGLLSANLQPAGAAVARPGVGQSLADRITPAPVADKEEKEEEGEEEAEAEADLATRSDDLELDLDVAEKFCDMECMERRLLKEMYGGQAWRN